MPDYQILITKTAQKQLDRMADSIANTLIGAIQDLSSKSAATRK